MIWLGLNQERVFFFFLDTDEESGRFATVPCMLMDTCEHPSDIACQCEGRRARACLHVHVSHTGESLFWRTQLRKLWGRKTPVCLCTVCVLAYSGQKKKKIPLLWCRGKSASTSCSINSQFLLIIQTFLLIINISMLFLTHKTCHRHASGCYAIHHLGRWIHNSPCWEGARCPSSLRSAKKKLLFFTKHSRNLLNNLQWMKRNLPHLPFSSRDTSLWRAPLTPDMMTPFHVKGPQTRGNKRPLVWGVAVWSAP